MSILRRVNALHLLGTGAAAIALCAASASGASATGTPGGDGWGSKTGGYKPGAGAGTKTEADRCQFSVDGQNFFDSVRVDDQNLKPTEDGKVHIKVRTAGDASTCTASLASYIAHGATFGTSGLQVFVDFDTVTVKQGQTDSLDIAVPDAGCFAQIDLYRGKVKFDGDFDANDGFEHGDLPKGPDRPVIKDKLIAAWNGGTKDCTTTPPPAEETPGTPTPTPTPPAEETPGTPTPSEPASETTPPASETPSTSTPTPSESTPESTPPATPASPDSSQPPLAETGGGSATVPLAGGAAALLIGGAAIVMATKRRKAGRAGS
ncbi:LAETG motif-containing sortase-dependent surface protein [Streptomyces sp. SID12488]|uniref:LAETG motif-containing sortase-dependent surface protein n=1 Tax=Streptomyces sp. SID12488 TaxID=2706040 RepID=UPI0013D9179E|nr:LAETG motif-containing sortase-dependent surface protein [Streptomyces sp. SID12488]NEA62814.1 LPXTG cell wall anchor domain-containing protein [Streptomyces sp. SID12488]